MGGIAAMLVKTMNAKRIGFMSIFLGAATAGCAAIVGADDYSVDKGSATGSGTGGSATGTGGSGGAGGSATGSGGAGGDAGKGGAGPTGGSGGVSGGGRGGAMMDSGPPGGSGGTGGAAGADAGPTCSAESPAGTAMCGPGKTCSLSACAPAAYACFPAGSAADGVACTAEADCASGMFCLKYGPDLNVCRRTCTIDSECATGSRCQGSYTSCSGTISGKYCERLCSDITRAGSAVCGPGFKCDASCNGMMVNPGTCFVAGPVTSGSCAAISDCAAGYSCIGNICRQACNSNADCSAGTTCSGDIFCGNTQTSYHFCQ